MSTFVKTTSTAATFEVKAALGVRLFIAFLRRLIDRASGKLFLIVDNLRVHHAVKVSKWVADHIDAIGADW